MDRLIKKVVKRLSHPKGLLKDIWEWQAHRLESAAWQSYSRLCLAGDSATWVLDWEMRELAFICNRLGIRVLETNWQNYLHKQSIFYSNQFILDYLHADQQKNRIGLAYFHGRPGSGVAEFDQIYQQLCNKHPYIDRIQVSHTEMRDIILESGIDEDKVFLIPIGINPSFFMVQNPESRRSAREKYGIPQSAIVIGSFQKDGNGWGEGLEPKLIKGPDVFIEVVSRLKQTIPELFVLLSGPARGYVKVGLEAIKVPYHHVYLKSYPQIGELFQALDLYVVASRQEGGPKAILESMASGVPLVTTRVGQAMDLVKHGRNGWMVGVGDVDSLAHYAQVALDRNSELTPIIQAGLETVQLNSYDNQTQLWKSFMTGFVS